MSPLWLSSGLWVAAAMLAPITAGAETLPPTYAELYKPHGVDEIGIWQDADEDERRLTASPRVIRDEALTGYVKGVLCETVGPERCKAARVYIVRTPIFNASMAPNGTVRVFSGLLLRMRSEAELATVLGHEFGHFQSRHSVKLFKAERGASDVLSWAGLLAAMYPGRDTRRMFGDLRYSVLGHYFRYGRDTEREADRISIGYLNAGRLRPQVASEVWQHAIAEGLASAAAKGLRKPRYDTIAFADSHPPNAERAATLAALAALEGIGRDDGAARYASAMAPFLPQWLDDQIRLNDFGASAYVIEHLAEGGWTAPLWLARGDLYRLRGNPRDLVAATDFYAKAVALDPQLADAQRGLGLSLIKTGRRVEGQAALGRYLALRPDAPDAATIAMLAKEP
ncbi:hypothetical protein GCM10011380_06140 [Sphingomonas metalli]|uniref:Peptidase M48 domain-containing protein n=1 Tax=Sphingomonas metalli TaxID=1779358 RepID=A0A916SVA0_9SPHN|nr:M48 family metallopeptidase [Sphingomonas metalli]GGB19310.1 hypothetical protein GCM10011380_06140 [Sphingomonas metalli]